MTFVKIVELVGLYLTPFTYRSSLSCFVFEISGGGGGGIPAPPPPVGAKLARTPSVRGLKCQHMAPKAFFSPLQYNLKVVGSRPAAGSPLSPGRSDAGPFSPVG